MPAFETHTKYGLSPAKGKISFISFNIKMIYFYYHCVTGNNVLHIKINLSIRT